MSDEPLIVGPESAVAPALLRREPDHVRQIDWTYAGGIAVLHLLALLAFVPWFFSWTGVLLVPIGMYTFGTLGINIGLHRLLTHRSLACPRWLERTLVLMGTCGWMDSPAYWVAVHRRHHQFADEERDPHSPMESLFWSHLGWYMVKVDPERRAELVQRYARDVLRDPLYAFLERNGNWLLPIAISWLVLFALGWGAALAAGAGTTGAVQFGASVLVWGGFVRACGGVPHHHERQFNHPSVGLPELSNQRQQQEQRLHRDTRGRRGLAQQSSRRSWFRPPRPALVGARHRLAPHPPARTGRPCTGRRHAVATPCRGDGRSRSAVSSASELHGVAPHASVTFTRCWRASRSPARAVLPRCRPRPAGRGRSPGT